MALNPDAKSKLLDILKCTVEACTECEGGYLLDDTGETVPCRCMRVFLYLMELVKAKIPADYWSLTLDELQIDKAYTGFVHYYLARLEKALSRSLGVIFFGANGIGKTSLMCEIGKETIVRGYTVQYFTAQQFVDAAKEGGPILREYQSGQILLLDEIDKVYVKKGSNFVTKTMEDFLRRSISAGKTVVACTNYDEAGFSEAFGDSTMSMLRRHSKFFEIEGKDYSDKLYDSWDSLLDSEYSFYTEEIERMAKRLADFRRIEIEV